MKSLVVTLFLLFLIGACSHNTPLNPATALPQKDTITCQMQKDVRHLHIIPLQTSGCSLKYIKYNTEKSIASSQANKQHCVDISRRIVTQLTQSGFTCE